MYQYSIADAGDSCIKFGLPLTVEKVMAAEQLVEFKKAFLASIARRRLTPEQVDAMAEERARVDAIYRAWIKTLSPEDVKRMVLIDAAAAAFESVRSRGYRTPHK